MKITIRGLLIDVPPEADEDISALTRAFCSAIRFSFKRLLESVKIGDLEKTVAAKYNLNIRQAKDAVEEARQIIASQRGLLKLNYENRVKKIKAIEKLLENKNLSERKKRALNKKLEKHKRKREYYEKFINTDTIPTVIFGTKELFIKRCKGLISKEEWQAARNNRVYSRGDKTKAGNPNLRVVIKPTGETILEISTLAKTETNRAIKISVPLYLPQKLSKKTGEVNGRDYRSMVLDYIQTGEAYQVELIKKDGKYYCHITIDEVKIIDYTPVYTAHNGMIGIDTNPDGFGLTVISKDGNFKKSIYLKQPELQYARSNRRANLCGELAARVVQFARENELGVAIEDLKFYDDRDVSSKFSRIKHQFIYRNLLTMLETACIRGQVELTKVKPQFTTIIGSYKYCHQYGIGIHNGAAMVIARRAYGYNEKVPEILKDKIVPHQTSFADKSEWGQWSTINKIIKKKGGTGFWIRNRKRILGLARAV